MGQYNKELIEQVEFLKSKRIIKKDAEIVEKTGFSKGVISNYLSGRIEASKNFIEAFNEVFKNDLPENKVSRETSEPKTPSLVDSLYELIDQKNNLIEALQQTIQILLEKKAAQPTHTGIKRSKSTSKNQ